MRNNHSKGRPPWSLALILASVRPSPVCLADAGAKVVINYVTNPETADAIAVDIKHRGRSGVYGWINEILCRPPNTPGVGSGKNANDINDPSAIRRHLA